MASAERDGWGEFLVTLTVAEVESMLTACREHGFASIQNLPVEDTMVPDGKVSRVTVVIRSQGEQTPPDVQSY